MKIAPPYKMQAVRVTKENCAILGNLFYGAPLDEALLNDIFYLIMDEALDGGEPFLMRKNAFDQNYGFVPPGEIEGTFRKLHLTTDELLRRFEATSREV